MVIPFGGNELDVATVTFAVLVGSVKLLDSEKSEQGGQRAVVAALNAAAFCPFLVLIVAPFSKDALAALLEGSKVPVCLAGVIGSLVTLNELRKS